MTKLPIKKNKPQKVKKIKRQSQHSWDEAKHPRGGKGTESGGRFVKKGSTSPPMPQDYHPDSSKYYFRKDVEPDSDTETSEFKDSYLWETWTYDYGGSSTSLYSKKAKKAYKEALEKWRKLPTLDTKTEWNKQWWATKATEIERKNPRLYMLGQGITEHEIDVINDWTSNGYEGIRLAAEYLESNKKAGEKYVYKLELFETALEKYMPYKGTVYRGMSLRHDVLTRWINAVGKDKTIRLRLPSSATRSHKEAYSFAKDKTVILRIRQRSGAWIEHSSQYHMEREVVLKRGTKYKIVRHKKVHRDKIHPYAKSKIKDGVEYVHYFTLIEVDPKHEETHSLSIY